MFRTYEPSRDRLVAIKAFRLDLTPEQGRALAGELERIAEAPLDHPSIVRPLGAGIEGTAPYLASEYIAGESLDVALRHYAPATLDKVLPFVTQLAGAVDFARAAGVGHGALHPRDIFVTPDEARATGFGVVQALENIGVRAPVRRPYTAPERVQGAEWDVRADVYSLAAIAFELLTGKRPVGAEVGRLGETAGPHADYVAEALARGLAEDPGERYGSALGLAAALEAASRGERPERASGAGAAAAAARAAAVDAAARTVEVEAGAAPMPSAEEPMEAPPSATARSGDSEDAQRGLTFEPEPGLDEDAGGRPDFDRLDRQLPEDVEVERDTDLEEIQLREDESRFRDELPLEPDEIPFREDEALQTLDVRSPGDADVEPLALRGPLPDVTPATGEDEDDRAAAAPVPDIEPEPEGAPALGTFEPSYSAARAAETQGPGEPWSPRETREPREPREHGSHFLPVALTLLLGLFVGFLAGYLVGARERNGSASGEAAAVTEAPAAPTSGRGEASPSTPAPAGTSDSRAPAAAPPADARETTTAARREAAQPSTPARGRLVVRSTPPGAQVYINGRRRGSTPLAVRDLTPGTYTVRIARSGYREQTQRISVGASGTREISVRLQRPPAAPPAAAPSERVFAGSVFVDSRPRGAQVYLDGRLMGVTPVQVPDVRAGAHVVRIELPDYRTWSTSTRVTAGEVARVRASLERIP